MASIQLLAPGKPPVLISIDHLNEEQREALLFAMKGVQQAVEDRATLKDALERIETLCQDRRAIVAQGVTAFVRVRDIAEEALDKVRAREPKG